MKVTIWGEEMQRAQKTNIVWLQYRDPFTRSKTDIRQTGPHAWSKVQNGVNRDFVEVTRDHRSITLFEPQKNLVWTFDVLEKTLEVSLNGGLPLHSVRGLVTGAKPVSWLVTRVVYGQNGKALGAFHKLPSGNWMETNADGTVEYREHRVTAQDDWKIQVQDINDGIFKFELDFHNVRMGAAQGRHNYTYNTALVDISCELHGYLANRVDCSTDLSPYFGSFRQTAEGIWTEDSRNIGLDRFTFLEVSRSVTKIELNDTNRGVFITLDLADKAVLFRHTHSREANKIYDISGTSRASGFNQINPEAVTRITFNAGRDRYLWRSTGETWTETDLAGNAGAKFRLLGQDADCLYIASPELNVCRTISLKNNTMEQRLATTATDAHVNVGWNISKPIAGLSGFRISSVVSQRGNTKDVFTQIGPDFWHVSAENGTREQICREYLRDDGRIALNDVHNNNVYYLIDVANGRTELNSQTWLAKQITVRSEPPASWVRPAPITHRSSMTQDYHQKSNTQFEERHVYRTQVKVPTDVHVVEVWAEEEVELTIGEQTYTVDLDKRATVAPNDLGRVSISLAATSLHAPALRVRTNQMPAHEFINIICDLGPHKKITEWPDWALHTFNWNIGIRPQISAAGCTAIQTSLQLMTSTKQHSYNKTRYGWQRDRGVVASNMKTPHWKLTFHNGGDAHWQSLHPHEVDVQTRGATKVQTHTQSFGSFMHHVGHLVKHGGEIIVHTAEQVGKDAYQTAKHVARDGAHTFSKVGEDLVSGDFHDIGSDLVKGGEALAQDLIKGGRKLGFDVASGLSKILVMTLKVAGKALQVVLSHTGFVGQMIDKVLNAAGAELGKVVKWLLDRFEWGKILKTESALSALMLAEMGKAESFGQKLKSYEHRAYKQLSQDIRKEFNSLSQNVDNALHARADGKSHIPGPPEGFSEAAEKVEWFVGKISHYLHDEQHTKLHPAAPLHTAPPSMDPLTKIINQQVGADGKLLKAALGSAIGDIENMFKQPHAVPAELLNIVFEIAKTAALISLDIINAVFEVILDMFHAAMAALQNQMRRAIEIPFVSAFYKSLTGQNMSVLTIAALAVAIPSTVMSEKILNQEPFPNGATQHAVWHDVEARKQAIVYASTNFVRSVLLTIDNVSTAKKAAAGTKVSPNHLPLKRRRRFLDVYGTSAARMLDVSLFGLDILSQMMSSPLLPDHDYVLPNLSDKDNVEKAPVFWSHCIWWYQWCGIAFNTVTGLGGIWVGNVSEEPEIYENGVYALNTAYGFAHLGLVITLNEADLKAAHAYIKSIGYYYSSPREYVQWYQHGGVALKTAGNSMGSLTEIADFGKITWIYEPLDGIPLIASGIVDFSAEFTEGVISAYRADHNALF